MSDEIRTPDCPWCGQPPLPFTGVLPWFCANDDCRGFTWDPRLTKAQILAGAKEIDLGPLVGGVEDADPARADEQAQDDQDDAP